jgi:general nucleoside transport system permease protein
VSADAPEPRTTAGGDDPEGAIARFVGAVRSQSLLVTVLAFVSAVAIGAVIIALSDEQVRTALGYVTARPSDTVTALREAVGGAYGSLLRGALGGLRPLSETLVSATPLILTGLAVALPFRAGLFNIGGEGQVLVAGATAGLVGFSLTGLPIVVHLPLALAAGMLGGAVWGAVPGILKARTGAHEVITTIMLNNIAAFLLNWLLLTTLFRVEGRNDPISKNVLDSAALPRLLGSGYRVHAGLFVAVLAVAAMWWLLTRSTTGFQLRAVGANPDAATTAGMSVRRSVVLVMTLAGALAGLAGASLVLGTQGRIAPGFSAGSGFDGINVALLGRGNPWGVLAAGLLFGALRAGGLKMQAETGTPLDLVVVIQALIVIFIAAPALVRAVYRIRAGGGLASEPVAKGWGA